MGATFRNLYDQFNVAAFVRNRHDHAVSILRWALILVPMAAAVGTLCAAFLWSLDAVKRLRFALPWLLYLLPLGGFVVGLVYHLTGRLVEGGNNLIVEQIHEPGGGVPLRMAPLILLRSARFRIECHPAIGCCCKVAQALRGLGRARWRRGRLWSRRWESTHQRCCPNHANV